MEKEEQKYENGYVIEEILERIRKNVKVYDSWEDEIKNVEVCGGDEKVKNLKK